MRKLLAALAIVGTAALGGCASAPHVINGVNGNAAGPIVPASQPASQPANPVPILRQTGAKVPAGEVLGDHDVYGNRMADATFRGSGGEAETVYTTTNLQQAMSQVGPAGLVVDDGDAVVVGHGFWIDVTAGTRWHYGSAADGSGDYIQTYFLVKPSVIAQRVYGHLLKAS
jgi:hypothetical protein